MDEVEVARFWIIASAGLKRRARDKNVRARREQIPSVIVDFASRNGSATMYARMVKIVCLLWSGAVDCVGVIFGSNKHQ